MLWVGNVHDPGVLKERCISPNGGHVTDPPRCGVPTERAMGRALRTRPFRCSRTQGFTLGWYAGPRWGWNYMPRLGMSHVDRICRNLSPTSSSI
jgi:hypothetical protein